MEWITYIAEGLLLLVVGPVLIFQSIEMLHALAEFLADFTQMK